MSYNQIVTRPLGRVHADGTPYFENEDVGKDSCFFDIMLHKHQDFNIDSVFYLGVQNRRTDPLWFDPSYANGQMIFTPTAEWDNLIANGGLSWKAPGDNRTAAWWRDKYWKRQGCREITIPFNYIPSDNKPRMLHVQEVGGTLDTMIYSNAKLALNYTPGEGKMFKVSVVRMLNQSGFGQLSNSNQRKIVCYPVSYYDQITQQLVSTNKMRYHMVYHRYDTILLRYSVYYKRSIIYENPQNVVQGIDWEAEIPLSVSGVQLENNNVEALNCEYPVLTVRPVPATTTPGDTPSVKVFVFYPCDDSHTETTIHLVENVLNADGIQIPPPAREIENSNGSRWLSTTRLNTDEFLGKWGAGAINASANGNYYGWADTSLGITVRWKPSLSLSFLNNGSQRESFRFSTNQTVCIHPSMNTFSRIGLNEQDAAIVWEEQFSPQAPNSAIAYTMVRPNGLNTIVHYLPNNLTNDTNFRNVVRADSTIVLLNDTTLSDNNVFPMLYRGIEEAADPSRSPRPIEIDHWDRIVWESIPEIGKSYISTRGIDYADAWNNNPSYWAVWYLKTVKSLYTNLHGPQISQGGRNFLFPKNNLYTDDSTLVLNFEVEPYTNIGLGGGGILFFPAVYQVIYGYWSFMPLNPSIHWDKFYPANLQWINYGRNPRLTALHNVLNRNRWSDNRRIYHSPITSYLFGDFYSSSEKFYKKVSNEELQPLYWSGFVLPSGRRTMFSLPQVDERYLEIKASDDNDISVKSTQFDTLKTSWFIVGNNSLLNSYAKGVNNPCLSMMLEKKSNRNVKIPIPYNTNNDDGKKRNSIRLLRGGNEEYRLIVINRCKNNIYTEEIQIDGIIPDEQLGKESESAEVITVDLGKELQHENILTVKPNPADNEIDVKFTGLLEDIETSNFDYSYVVTDAIGRTMEKGLLRAGGYLHINTSTYVSGTYYVRVKGSVNSVSVPFVIIR